MKFEIYTNSKGEYYAITRNWLGFKSKLFNVFQKSFQDCSNLEYRTEHYSMLYTAKSLDELKESLHEYQIREQQKKFFKGRKVETYEVK